MPANVARHPTRSSHLWLRGGSAAVLVVLGVTGVVGAVSVREHRADGPSLEVVVLRTVDRVAHAVIAPGVR